MNIEERIFAGLISDEDYTRKVIPHLKHEYFHDRVDYQIFNLIEHYIQKYNRVPSKEALLVDLGNAVGLSDDEFKGAETKLKSLSKVVKDETAWLLDTTERFCQDKALFNSLREAIKVMDGKGDQISKTGIPNLLQEALAISFDNAIGHDYIEDSESRYEFYHRKEERLEFDIELLNRITKGGLPRRTLSFILAASGVGKSLIMCHMATANLLAGKNVLYITLELAEERIGERIDANLLNVTLDELYDLPRSTFEKRINAIKDKTPGKLIIKEYPTSSAGSANFRFLLQELRMKKNFVPDIIYIDYLNICISSRIKQGANVNSYAYIKSIAEELRGLAVEFNIPIVSATQTNRCLSLDTLVIEKTKGIIRIDELELGDQILSDNSFNKVKKIYEKTRQKTFLIKTKSGKSIRCSSKHIFPTLSGLQNIDSGLAIGEKFFVNNNSYSSHLLNK